MLQIMIEAESVDDLRKQVHALASEFAVSSFTVPDDSAPSTPSAATVDPGAEQPAPRGNDDNPPAPTQKTVKMAEEMGIDIADVKGTGKNGRVTQADLKEYAKNRAPSTQEEPAPEPAAEPAAEPATTPSGGDTFAENEDSTPDAGTDDIEPTKENAKNALRVVHGEKGMDACMKVLQANGARKIGELKEESYAAFIQNCAEDIGVDVSGLKEKIEALEG